MEHIEIFENCCNVLYGISLLSLSVFALWVVIQFVRKRLQKTSSLWETGCVWLGLSVLIVSALFSSPEYSCVAASCSGFLVSSPLILLFPLEMKPVYIITVAVSAVLVSSGGFFVCLVPVLGKYSFAFPLMSILTAAFSLHFDLQKLKSGRNVPLYFRKARIMNVHSGIVLLLVSSSIGLVASLSRDGGFPLKCTVPPLCILLQVGIFCFRTFEILSGKRVFYKRCGLPASQGISDLCPGTDCELPDDDSYYEIYKRLTCYFEEEKPYLNPKITMLDAARSIYTNKAYVSKAVNLCTGRNFCQFVNYYRIKYSVELFMSDPTLKVSSLARRSGFNSVPTFNVAFRLYMNDTPKEWCRKYLAANQDDDGQK